MYIHSESGYSGVCYVDDLAGVEVGRKAKDAFVNLGHIINKAGFIESKGKACCEPSTCMLFLGIEFDTVKMECHIPEQKLQEVRSLLSTWLEKRSSSKTNLQSLIGSLQFISECVRAGRIFTSRIPQVVSKLKRQHHKFRIDREFRKDLTWWLQVLDQCNEKSLIPEAIWSSPDEIFSTDACLEGCGSVCNNECF